MENNHSKGEIEKVVGETYHRCTLGKGGINFAEHGQKDGESRVLDILHTRREQRQACDERIVIVFSFSWDFH